MSSTIKSDKIESAIFDVIELHFQNAIRGDKSYIDAHLQVIDKHSVKHSATTIHCHFIKLDGNQRPKVSELSRFLAGLVIDYAIPREEIEKAKKHLIETGSTEMISSLKTKAKSLFVDINSNSGEGGEILLFALAERYLNLPQLICKMPLKTSSSVHYHGIDGIHAKVDKLEQKLLLYWGESKLHKTIGKATSECFKTIAKFLNSSLTPGEVAFRDIGIIKDNVSLTDVSTQDAILAILDENNPLHNRIEFRAICFVGFDFNKYPNKPMQMKITELESLVRSEYQKWQKTIETKLLNKKDDNLPSFVLEILLLPFPDVESFRNEFVKQLALS